MPDYIDVGGDSPRLWPTLIALTAGEDPLSHRPRRAQGADASRLGLAQDDCSTRVAAPGVDLSSHPPAPAVPSPTRAWTLIGADSQEGSIKEADRHKRRIARGGSPLGS